MKVVIGILLLVCIVIATIYMTNSHKDDGRAGSKKAETLKINADGTMTLESIKEDFMRIENEYEQTYGLDDHVHLRYWTNKATRFSIWAGLVPHSNILVVSPGIGEVNRNAFQCMAQVEFCESCTDLLNIYEAIGRAKPTF